ncbi:MAG: excinuclease ABC subunit UvrB [Candidatus Sumerlaeia bacterium]
MSEFELISPYQPQGDQPRAIEQLVEGLKRGARHQTLLGVTGSGKTFTMAHIIARIGMPALVIAPNKTLAAQLYREFKELFPRNAVEYFVSYYDYYQPEAYIPQSDTYIEKDSSINEELDKLRLSATRSVLERRDVIVVASVSCIYGIGSPDEYHAMVLFAAEGDRVSQRAVIERLVQIQYQRRDLDFFRGSFRVRGDALDVYPAYEDKTALRLEWFGDQIEGIFEIDALRGVKKRRLKRAAVYPANFYVTARPSLERALKSIRAELEDRVGWFESQGRMLEAQRLRSRTEYDLELMRETGHCPGIENYSRHLTGRAEGEPPDTLLSYFPGEFLTFIDESHITIPQLRAMFEGDRSRKKTLVEFGFRLPSALDNRPLRFEETMARLHRVIYVSATPSEWELRQSGGVVAEQIIRPTGLMDPAIEVRPARNQVDDLIEEARRAAERGQRVLVTTLTKRMAEYLTEHLQEIGVRARYLHSDIQTIERTEILRDLRRGQFDVLVGINLLREGLDLPEVALVAVLDADKEGFLRSTVSLIQTCGRAARNADGRVILYADQMTESIRRTVEETNRRRAIQAAFNQQHGITPQTIRKDIKHILDTVYEHDYAVPPAVFEDEAPYGDPRQAARRIEHLRRQMKQAAAKLDFERAAELRDTIAALEQHLLEIPARRRSATPPAQGPPGADSSPDAKRRSPPPRAGGAENPNRPGRSAQKKKSSRRNRSG